jgi:SAM-dependent methyltransferase
LDDEEIRRSAALEQRHWWYAGRRALVRKLLRGVPSGRALDIGTGSGGNTQTLAELGWQVTGLEYSATAVRLAAARGLPMVQGDARALPFADEQFDLVMSTDMWEHIDDDLRVAQESFRVCRRGGRALIAVPAGMSLWSGHDVALGHVRRYERAELVHLVEKGGFRVHDVLSWNVLLRPVAMARRRRAHHTSESEMQPVHPVLNAGLRSVVAIESALPVQGLPGISLVVRAVRD